MIEAFNWLRGVARIVAAQARTFAIQNDLPQKMSKLQSYIQNAALTANQWTLKNTGIDPGSHL